MITIIPKESIFREDHSWTQSFQIEPFEMGQSITFANSLRRVLINDLTGYAITSARLDQVSSEFDPSPFLHDDTLEILGHLEAIIFQEAFQTNTFFPKFQGFFHVQGPCIVTAGMLKLPKNSLRIINPNQYICTLVTSDEFFCEVDIELGKGYRMVEEYEHLSPFQPFYPSKPVSLFMDSSFTPIKAVFYSVQLRPDVDGTLKESLTLTITTKGSKSPSRCMYEGLKFLIDLFYPFLDFSSNLVKSSEFAKVFQIKKPSPEKTIQERDSKRKENVARLRKQETPEKPRLAIENLLLSPYPCITLEKLGPPVLTEEQEQEIQEILKWRKKNLN